MGRVEGGIRSYKPKWKQMWTRAMGLYAWLEFALISAQIAAFSDFLSLEQNVLHQVGLGFFNRETKCREKIQTCAEIRANSSQAACTPYVLYLHRLSPYDLNFYVFSYRTAPSHSARILPSDPGFLPRIWAHPPPTTLRTHFCMHLQGIRNYSK